jgi:hypothetical protein
MRKCRDESEEAQDDEYQLGLSAGVGLWVTTMRWITQLSGSLHGYYP